MRTDYNCVLMRYSGRRTFVVVTMLALGIGAAPAAAVTPEAIVACQAVSDTDVIALGERYIAKLQSRHPDQLTRLFASDGAMHGFASPVVRTDYKSVREYFLYFLQFEPQLKFEDRLIEIGCNYVIDQGNYTWSLKAKGAALAEDVPARFRFIYEYSNGDWRIAEHIEELTAANTDETRYAVADPQTPRIPAISAAVPAVAGFVKRATEVPSADKVEVSKPAKTVGQVLAPPVKLGGKQDTRPAQNKQTVTKIQTPPPSASQATSWQDGIYTRD